MGSMRELPGMIGLAEGAQRLGLPYQDAHRLLLTGVLQGVKRGGRWFVTRESVERVQQSGAGQHRDVRDA
jgi:hypothetical protein